MAQNIEAFDFLDDLNNEEKYYLQKHLKPVTFAKNTILFYQGDTTKEILLLTKGSIRLYIQGEGINEIELYILNPMEQCIVNTTSAINLTPTIGSAVTLTDIEGYMLDREIVLELMQTNKRYQSYIFSLFTIRLDTLAKLLESIKFKQMDERVYEYLQSQQKNPLNITHEEIAQALGSNRVVISRTLKKLEREGLLKLLRGSITLL